MNKLKPYTKRVGALILTVEPMWKAGHGEYPNTWVARVDMDVPEYDTTANIACTHFGRLNPAVGQALSRSKNLPASSQAASDLTSQTVETETRNHDRN